MKTLISTAALALALTVGPAASAQDMGGVPGVAAAAAHGQQLSNASGTAAYGASQYRTEYSFGDLLSRVSQGIAGKLDALAARPGLPAEQETAADEKLSVTAR